MKGCDKKFNYTCSSILGTSLTSEKVCGWHNGNGGFYLCPDCEDTEKNK